MSQGMQNGAIEQLRSEIEPLGYTIQLLPHPSFEDMKAWFVVKAETPDVIYEPFGYEEGIRRGAHGVDGKFWYCASDVDDDAAAAWIRNLLKRYPLTDANQDTRPLDVAQPVQ